MKKLKKHQSPETEDGGPDILFVQMKKINMIEKGMCFCCIEKGHKASECEKKKKSRTLLKRTQCTCHSNNFCGWHDSMYYFSIAFKFIYYLFSH
jgi:hypothetical protein